MNTSSIMFALLRSVFQQKELEKTMKEELSPEIFCEIYTLAQKHDLGHLIAQAMENNGLFLDEPIAKKFLAKRSIAVYRVEQIEYELSEIGATLDEARIEYVPLKGALIRRYYPENWYRTCCDIDLLVQEEKLKDAVDVLEARLGYVNHGKGYHDVSMSSPSGVHLELHFNLFENQANIDGLLSKVWEYTQKAEGSFRRVMNGEFLLFHIIAHTSYHFLKGGCGVRPILDLYILEKNMPYDKEQLAVMLRECRLTKFHEGLLALSSAWFDGEPLKEEFKGVERYVLNGGVYGTLENRITVGQAQSGGKIRYFFRRLFMPYKDLKSLYPSLAGKKWLTPFYQIRRWGRLIFCGRLKKSMREFNINASLEKGENVRVKEMMQTLELL